MSTVIGYSVSASSNLAEVGYDPGKREFYVRFRSGGQGVYSEVSIEDATAVIRADDPDKEGDPSHGATLIKRLKTPGLPYRQLTDMPWDGAANLLSDILAFRGFTGPLSTPSLLSRFADYADLLRNAVVYA